MKNSVTQISNLLISNPYGFTLNLNTRKLVSKGFAIADLNTQNNTNIDKAIKYCKNNDIACVGGWIDYETNKTYIDAVHIVNDIETAIKLGRINKQIAIYDITNDKEIRL